jgi:hypothetical protein
MRRFEKHYTRDEARALLPRLREWLDRLEDLRAQLEKNEKRVAGLMNSGQDAGGSVVNQSVRLLGEIKGVLQNFEQREIILKDLQRGLVDFPAIVGGREVFLCWEKDEEDVDYWHDIDSGYAGREPL